MKKRVKRKFNIKKFLVFVLFLIIVYFSVSFVLSIRTKNIVILNSNYYSDETIIETAGIEDYPKFLKVNKKNLKNKLLKLELIEDVRVSKRL